MPGLKSERSGIQFDAAGNMVGIVTWAGHRDDWSVGQCLHGMTTSVDDLDLESCLLMLSEHQRCGRMSETDRARIHRWFEKRDVGAFAPIYREMNWGEHPVPPEHFWWFSRREQAAMDLDKAA